MPVLDKQYYHNQIKRSLVGAYQPHGDPAQADSVLATGFGYRIHEGNVVPSMSTRQIAQAVAKFEHLPKVLSHDVATAYRKLMPHDTSIIHEILHPEKLSSVRLANQMRDILKFYAYSQPLLLTHQHHMPWFDYLCGQIDVHTIVPRGLQFAFDPISVQPWTRDEASWQQEIKARLRHGLDESYHAYTTAPHHG